MSICLDMCEAYMRQVVVCTFKYNDNIIPSSKEVYTMHPYNFEVGDAISSTMGARTF